MFRTNREAALALARVGLPVAPYSGQVLKPLTRRGYLDATTDVHQIQDWWRAHPRACAAIPTGQSSGLAALSIAATLGSKALLWVDANRFALRSSGEPITVTARTDANHELLLLYRHQPGTPSFRWPSVFGLSVKAEGGFFVPADTRPLLQNTRPLTTTLPPWPIILQRASKNASATEYFATSGALDDFEEPFVRWEGAGG